MNSFEPIQATVTAATVEMSTSLGGAASSDANILELRVEYVRPAQVSNAPPACPLTPAEAEFVVSEWATGGRVDHARPLWLQLRPFLAPEAQAEGDAALVLAEARARWHGFIENLPDLDTRMTSQHVAAVRSFLDAADQGPRRLPPSVTQAPDAGGPVHLAWSKGNHYLDVDVFPDGSFEWFYKDRETGSFEGTADERELQVSEALRARLQAISD